MTVVSDTLGAASILSNNPFNIGGQITASTIGYELTGYLGQFMVHNVCRDAAYMAANFAGESAPAIDSNTKLYYDWREGSGTTTADRSGNGYTATVFGSPVTWI